MVTAEVSYQVGTYHGTIEVTCDPDDDTDTVIAKAKAKLRRTSGPSYYPSGCCYESWRVVDRRA